MTSSEAKSVRQTAFALSMSNLEKSFNELKTFNRASKEFGKGITASNSPFSLLYSEVDRSRVGTMVSPVSIEDTFTSEPELVNANQAKRVDENLNHQSVVEINEAIDDIKSFASSKYLHSKKEKGRRNLRESKKSLRNRRKKLKRTKISPHAESSDVSPSRESQDDSSVELPPGYEAYDTDSAQNIEFTNTPLRNEMLRAAISTPPSSVSTSDELMSLLSTASTAPDLVPESHKEQLEEWVGHLENLTILGYQMSQATSYMDCFVAVIAYLKMYIKGKSITLEIFNLINEATRIEDSEGEIEPHSWGGRELLEGWDLFKSNPIFKKISYLLTAAMSMSICTQKSIEWSCMGLQLVSLEAAKEQLKAVDFIDAVIKTFVWMAETGWQVFSEKSLAPLLYGDAKMRAYNEKADYILAHADNACSGNMPNLNDFEKMLDEVTEVTISYKKAQPTGVTALWLQKRYSELVDIKLRLIAKRKNTSVRFCPKGWSLAGGSGVGKTTLAKLTMNTSLHAMDFACSPDRIITIDPDDEYDSTVTSDNLGMFFDDFGNTKSAFTKKPPTSMVTKFFNNMCAQAVKAELHLKGVVFLDFKVGVLTTNVEDLCAREVSNCPESILRRFHHVKVRVKPQYRIPGGSSLDPTHPELQNVELTKDVWELDVRECIPYESGNGKRTWKMQIMTVETLDGSKVVCENLDLNSYLDVVVALSKTHARVQNGIVHRSSNFDEMEMCTDCYKPKPICRCVEKIEPHALDFVTDIARDVVTKSVTSYFNSFYKPLELINSVVGYAPVRSMTTSALTKELTQEIDKTVTPLLISITPEWLYRTSVFQRSVQTWRKAASYYDVRRYIKLGAFVGGATFAVGLKTRSKELCGWSIMGSLIGSSLLHCVYQQRVRCYEDEYVTRRDALPAYAKSIRDGVVPKFALFSATLVVGITMIRLWNTRRIETKNYSPDSLSDPKVIDAKPGWFGYVFDKIGVKVGAQKASTTATCSQLETTLEKNCFWAEFTRPDGSATRCNIFFPRKGVAMFPHHVFYPGADMQGTPAAHVNVHVTRSLKGAGGVFDFIAELSMCDVLTTHDLVSVFVPNSPDIKDASMWLPTSQPSGKAIASIMVRHADATIEKDGITVTMQEVGHKYQKFYGGSYDTRMAQTGACMAPIIADTKKPVILGFHIGGNAKSRVGVMQTLTLPEYNASVARLQKVPGVNLSSHATDLPETQYGKTILQSQEVHPNAKFIRELPATAYVDVLGSTQARTVQRSRVEPSILSDAVEEHCGVPNSWDKPQLSPNWKAYNATLEHIVSPTAMFLPSELERARQDWLEPLLPAMDEYVKHEDFRPLQGKEVVLGIPGKRFLDAVPMNTGMGFPVFGPKERHFEEIRDGEILVDRVPSAEIAAEMERQMDCWKRGERAYPVCAATLKDEPTTIGKEKVRVFQAVAVAFGLHIRKYFLPVARFLSMHPLLSESAVGVNAFSKDWEELMGHATKYGHEDDMVIAWDYSKYDVSMNSQMTVAVIRSFIDIAERGGYPPEDLHIMRMMAWDIEHPALDYNGTFILAYNMNTSGNNITVNINGTAGSLYVRMGYFHIFPEEKDFRKYVSAMTYGDDFEGSVHKSKREFNFFTYKAFLAKHGMKITPPDKSSEGTAFMRIQDADFLKRKSMFIPEIGTTIGALDEKSIFKSLHSNLKSTTCTKKEVAASCVEGALHEWFAHGRSQYDLRSEQLKLVCRDANLPITSCFHTFDSRVEMWKEKYESRNV